MSTQVQVLERLSEEIESRKPQNGNDPATRMYAACFPKVTTRF
jgi:hypothetical protein